MMLWIVLTVMCSVAAVLVSVPFIRRFEQRAKQANAGVGIYADQIRELERDRGIGLIGESEADLAKTEIERRLLASVKMAPVARPVSPLWRTAALAAATGFVVLGSVNLYALRGRPDLAAAMPPVAMDTNAPAAGTPVDAISSAAATTAASEGQVGNLANRLQENPADAEGWRMLGWSYFNTQRYEESASAYARAVALAPENLDYKSAYGEALVQAAQGVVTPNAQELFAEVLKKDAKENRAQFYEALAREQAGDLPAALDKWIGLLVAAPPDAGWVETVRQHIAELGPKSGRDVSQFLVNAPAQKPTAAGSLAAEDQQSMIDGMIAKLAAKLENNPRDRDGWAMMIRSLRVKGDMAGAQAAFDKALQSFSDDPSTRQQIVSLAQALGVTATDEMGSGTGSAPVINQNDVAAVQALSTGDQSAMIMGMVEGLSNRLSKSPHDADGWLRLIRSRMALGQSDLARDALKKALAEFSGDSAVSDQIVASARQLGVTLD
jgi:cytochrome c-type biogenesis protein CcmH